MREFWLWVKELLYAHTQERQEALLRERAAAWQERVPTWLQ